MPMNLVPYRITICGLAELCRHNDAGITHVLTILDPDWPDPNDFRAYAPHRRTVWRFHDVISEQAGMVVPQAAHVAEILEFGRKAQDEPMDHLLVHCHMGISRSTATAIILMAQFNQGREGEAFDHLWNIRPRSWPNSRMLGLADSALGRRGRLVEAMREHHTRVARTYPDLAAALSMGERAGEVPHDFW
ncbi:MAG: protein-tyrosine-phosphatase [Rhodospirillaceae bacterium]|nr:protein-tyrosine-phosphatase [Rhodospirillales bacterium]